MADHSLNTDGSASATLPLAFEGATVRIVDRGGDPWFVLADACRVLEIANPRNAAARLDDDEKGVHSVDTLGGPQSVRIISEPGLYAVIRTSRKPAAKRFDRWVRHEVLPAIRRTGRYEALGAGASTAQIRDLVVETVGAVLPKVLEATLPQMIEARIVTMRYGIVEGVTAGDVLETAGINERKGLRGLAQFVSRCLERYHIAKGVPMREGKLGAARARLFDPAAAKAWLREGGKLAIERWISERTKRAGQGVLRLVPLGEGAPAA